jgi:hypothetical protein
MDANGLDKSIHSPDLANGLSVEANWLVSPACGMLTKISYTRWKTALVNSGGHLKAICGFGAKEMGSYLSADFFEEFSGRLARNHCQPEENDWWQVSAPSDPGVIAWMENACNRLNNWDPGRGPLYELIPETEAAAVDQLTRYRLYSPGGAYTGAHYTIIADP